MELEWGRGDTLRVVSERLLDNPYLYESVSSMPKETTHVGNHDRLAVSEVNFSISVERGHVRAITHLPHWRRGSNSSTVTSDDSKRQGASVTYSVRT